METSFLLNAYSMQRIHCNLVAFFLPFLLTSTNQMNSVADHFYVWFSHNLDLEEYELLAISQDAQTIYEKCIRTVKWIVKIFWNCLFIILLGKLHFKAKRHSKSWWGWKPDEPFKAIMSRCQVGKDALNILPRCLKQQCWHDISSPSPS